jgi:hypothetical protein
MTVTIFNRYDHTKAVITLGDYTTYATICNRTLNEANFSKHDFHNAIFRDCKIKNGLFHRTGLTHTTFTGCDLRGSEFIVTNMNNCSLFNCNLKTAQFRITDIFRCNWEEIEDDDLLKDCMLYDQEHHPKPELFDKWANNTNAHNTACPYVNRYVYVKQEINFIPNPEVWKKIKRTKRIRSAYEIMMGLFKEKAIKY